MLVHCKHHLRQAGAKVLAERLALQEPPVPLPPPPLPPSNSSGGQGSIDVPDACLYCGIGTVTMSPLAVSRAGRADAAARASWRARQVASSSVGATRGGPTLRGWLCPPCETAASEMGSASTAKAVELALSTYLGAGRRTLAGDELWVRGLQTWGALVADAQRRGRFSPAANQSPWGHLAEEEQERIAQDLRRGGA